MKRISAPKPAMNEWSLSQLINWIEREAAVTITMRSNAGFVSFIRRGGRSCHARACTTASTLSKVRSVVNSA